MVEVAFARAVTLAFLSLTFAVLVVGCGQAEDSTVKEQATNAAEERAQPVPEPEPAPEPPPPG